MFHLFFSFSEIIGKGEKFANQNSCSCECSIDKDKHPMMSESLFFLWKLRKSSANGYLHKQRDFQMSLKQQRVQGHDESVLR